MSRKQKSAERDERVREWTQSKPAKREKVTAEQVATRGEERRAERARRREARGPRDGRRAVRLAATALAAAGAVALVVMTGSASSAINAERDANSATIMSLVGQVSDAQKVAREATSVDAGQVSVVMESAQKAADVVAGLQNDYQGIVLSTKVVDGRSTVVGQDEYKAVNASMRALFSEASQAGTFDPTLQWFQMWNETDAGWVVAGADEYVWTASQVLEGTSSAAPVLWQLRETSTGDLLAWATGTYDASTGLIGKVSVSTTAQGDERVAPSDSGEDGTTHQEG